MHSIKIKLQRRPSGRKYFNYSIDLPKKLVDSLPAFKKARFVYIDTDLLGNVIIRAKRFLI